MYGNEEEVGRALARQRRPARGALRDDEAAAGPGRARARDARRRASRALGLEHVDLWLIHWPAAGGARPDVWERFLERRGGRPGAGGRREQLQPRRRSTSSARRRARCRRSTRSSGARPLYDATHARAHRRRDVQLEGYSPLRTMRTCATRACATSPSAHGVTPAQVVIRWHLEHGIVVIPKSTDAERIAENADVFGFALSADEVRGARRARQWRPAGLGRLVGECSDRSGEARIDLGARSDHVEDRQRRSRIAVVAARDRGQRQHVVGEPLLGRPLDREPVLRGALPAPVRSRNVISRSTAWTWMRRIAASRSPRNSRCSPTYTFVNASFS